MTVVTVGEQYIGESANGTRKYQAILRVRGKTISDVFPPGTKVRVVRQILNERIVIVLEECKRGNK